MTDPPPQRYRNREIQVRTVGCRYVASWGDAPTERFNHPPAPTVDEAIQRATDRIDRAMRAEVKW